MSIPPKVWGAAIWRTMYAIAYTFPDQPTLADISTAMDFYTSLGKLLPCGDCRQHYLLHLDTNPIDCRNRDALLGWINRLQNAVNTRIGRPATTIDDNIKEFKGNEIRLSPLDPPDLVKGQTVTQNPSTVQQNFHPAAGISIRKKPVVKKPPPPPCNCGAPPKPL